MFQQFLILCIIVRLEVGGEIVNRNGTFGDLFFGRPLVCEQYGQKKLQIEYDLGHVGSLTF